MANEISRDDLLKAVAVVAASNFEKARIGRLQLYAISIYEQIRKPEFWSRESLVRRPVAKKKRRGPRVRDLES